MRSSSTPHPQNLACLIFCRGLNYEGEEEGGREMERKREKERKEEIRKKKRKNNSESKVQRIISKKKKCSVTYKGKGYSKYEG